MKQLIIAIFALLAITSCANYHYDEELRTKIETEGRQKTEEWFKKNKPEADSLSMETVYTTAWNYITNLVEGSYMVDTIPYQFMFNYETGTCVTNEHSQELHDSIIAKLKERNAPDSIIMNYHYRCNIKGQTISNKTDFPYTHHYSEIKRENINEQANMLPWNVTKEDINRIVTDELNRINTKKQ